MRRLIFLLVLLVLTACGVNTSSETPQSGLIVGNPAPDFSTQLMNGSIQSLKGLRGKVALVNFWATWCGPCRTEMPYFQQLADQYKDQGFTVLAINNREGADKILPFTDEQKLRFSVGLDLQGKIDALYSVHQYPTTYVIGRDGTILARQFGPFDPVALETALKIWLK